MVGALFRTQDALNGSVGAYYFIARNVLFLNSAKGAARTTKGQEQLGAAPPFCAGSFKTGLRMPSWPSCVLPRAFPHWAGTFVPGANRRPQWDGPSCRAHRFLRRRRFLLQVGWQAGCRRKLKSNLPHGAVSIASATPGGQASTWYIPSKATSRIPIPAKTVAWQPLQVGSFASNGYGLFDKAGSVSREWVSHWYRPELSNRGGNPRNRDKPEKGPADSFDPNEPGVQKRVQRGGPFLCTDQYCSRYIPGGRGKGELDTGTNHLGFRCVHDVSPKPDQSKTVVKVQPEVLSTAEY